MRMLGNRRGYTLIEVLLVMGIMGFVGAGAMSVMLSSVSCFDNTTTETFTDTDAVLAMQMIVRDVREARGVVTLDDGKRLRVTPPVRVNETWASNEGYYDCHQADTARQIDFYISDETGQVGRSGECLWRSQSGDRDMLKRGVVDVFFQVDTDQQGKVWITVTTRNGTGEGARSTQLTNRVVYLRNYRNN